MKSLLDITHSQDLDATLTGKESVMLPINARRLLVMASKEGIHVLDQAIHEIMSTYPEFFSARALREKSAEPVRRIKGYE